MCATRLARRQRRPTPRHQNGPRWRRRLADSSVLHPTESAPQPEDQHDEPRQPGRKPVRREQPAASARRYPPVRPPAPPRPSMRTTKSIGKHQRAGRDRRQRHGHDGDRERHRPEREAQASGARRRARSRRRRRQNPFSLHRLCAAVDGGKQRRHGADAAAGDDVELDAGFVQRAEDAGVIRAGRAGAGQNECGAKLWGVGVEGSADSVIPRLRREW